MVCSSIDIFSLFFYYYLVLGVSILDYIVIIDAAMLILKTTLDIYLFLD